jgi:ankyrin repeat protein
MNNINDAIEPGSFNTLYKSQSLETAAEKEPSQGAAKVGIGAKLLEMTEKKLEAPHNQALLRDLETQLKLFHKIDLFFSQQNIQDADIETRKSNVLEIRKAIDKITGCVCEILNQDKTDVKWLEHIKKGHSFLNAAILENRQDIGVKLIESGTDIESCIETNCDSFAYACALGEIEIVRALLKNKIDLNKLDPNTNSPFEIACRHRHPEVIKLLAENGADVDRSVDTDGNTLLIQAAILGHLETVQALLASKADINKQNRTGASALFTACVEDMPEIVQELILRGALVDVADGDGYTPLMMSCNEKIVTMLLDHKADINKQNSKGESALHAACYHGKLDIAQLLINRGAEVNIRSSEGHTPLSYTVRKIENSQANDIIKILIRASVKESEIVRMVGGTSALHELFKDPAMLTPQEYFLLFSKLLSQNIDLTYKDEDGHTPLGSLFLADKPKEVKEILIELFRDFPSFKTVAEKNDVITGDTLYENSRLIKEQAVEQAKANPLSIALLLGDPILTQTFSLCMSEEECIKSCQALAETYPKSPVYKFLCFAFLSLPGVLPGGHIRSLFDLLRQEVDVTEKDEDFLTPLHQVLELDIDDVDYRERVTNFFKGFFSGVEVIQERLKAHGTKDFLEYFIEHPEGLLTQSNVNPLEVALLFGSIPLARAIASKLKQNEFLQLGDDLKKRFPKTDLEAFLFNVEYQLNPEHLTKIFSGKIPTKPDGSTLDDFLKLFDTMNFSDSTAPYYVDPSKVGIGKDKKAADVREVIKKFLQNVKERKDIEGDRRNIPLAHTEFYDTLENGVCGIAHQLLNEPESTKREQQKIRMINEFIKDVGYCGPKLRVTTIRQYNNVVRKYEPTFDNLLYSKTTDHRSIITEGILPNGEQSTHDYIKVVKACGKDFGLAELHDLSEFDDVFGESGEGIDEEHIKQAFFDTYTPYAIFSFVKDEIASDEEFREQYATWWQAHAPESWNGEPIDPNDFVEKGLALKEAMETVRRQNFVLEEVYENARENRFKNSNIIKSLQELHVIGRAVIFSSDP